MNQILYVEEKKKNTKIEIKKIVRFFSVFIILFGITLASQGSYTLYNSLGKEESQMGNANIEVTQDESEVIVNVTNTIGIDKIVYAWGESSEQTIECNNNMNIEESIEVPVGKNILSLKVYDVKGKCTQYTQEYTLEEIDFVMENNTNMIKIIARDSDELSYITYAWNNEDATTIEGNGKKVIEKEIQIPVGLNTLKVVSVNSKGKTKIKEQELKGIEATKVTAELEENPDVTYVVITLTDDIGIKTIKHVTNNGEPEEIDAGGNTTFQYKQVLLPGKHVINLTIINNENIKTEQEIICNN